MNLNKIQKKIEEFNASNKLELLTNKEFLVYIANLLIFFGKAGVDSDEAFNGLNLTDSNVIENLIANNPNNLYLASLMQAHVLLYWSNQIEG